MNLDKVCEGVHYELTPSDQGNEMSWDVRILQGSFPETVIRFGKLRFEEEYLHFDFIVVSSPDNTADEDNIELQDYAAEILEDIIINAEANGSLIKSDSKND